MHAATSWTAKALELATRYRDDVMTSYILSRKSMHAASRRDARLTLELARSAQEPPHLPPRVRAVSLVMEAYGLGLLGDAGSCLRGFDRASDVIDSVSDVDGDDGDAVARYCTLSFVDVWRATSLTELGRPSDAIGLFEKALSALPPVYYRDRANYGARLAIAYARERAPDTAAHLGEQARQIAVDTESVWAWLELAKLRSSLRPWAHRAPVARFFKALTVPTNPLLQP